MRAFQTLIMVLLFVSCNNRDSDNWNSSSQVNNREYEIDTRNGYKDLSFGDHIDSVKVKLFDNSDIDKVELEEENIEREKKVVLTVQDSYLNSLGEIKFSKIDLYFFDNQLFEIRFVRSSGNSDLFYNTLNEVFGFHPKVETGWQRNKTFDEWWNDTRSSSRTGEPYSNKVDLESRVWNGRKVSARLIGEKWGSSLFGRNPDDIIWNDLRIWNLELSQEAKKYISEAPSRTAKDF